MTQRDSRQWVVEQYRTPGNLQARMHLHERFSTNPRHWQNWVFDQIEAPADARVLEIGCGPGALWTANRTRIPAGWQLLITDLSPGMVQQASSALAGAANVAFGVVAAQALPFADGAFDVLIANHMLYHVPERARALAEFHRVLRPGARLYAATNGKNHMVKIRELALRFAPQAAGQTGMHERFTFEQAAEELGQLFASVELRPYDNRLLVTDADALADYMMSETAVPMAESAQGLLRRRLHQEMAKTGQIEIVNETGLFEAVKAPAKASVVEAPPRKRQPARRRTAHSRKQPPSDDE